MGFRLVGENCGEGGLLLERGNAVLLLSVKLKFNRDYNCAEELGRT